MLIVPVLAFLVWAALLSYYFPVIRMGLTPADQVLASLLFVSHLILILVWSLSGPVTAAILSVLSVLVAFYLCLALREPALFAQALAYGLLYLTMVFFLYEVQKKLNDRRILREKIHEDRQTCAQEMLRDQEWEKALKRRIDRFLDLHQFAETLKGVPTMPQLARRVVEEAHALVPGAGVCVLYLVDESSEGLSWAASSRKRDVPGKDDRGSVFDHWVMRRSRPLLIEDSQTDFRFSTEKKRGVELLRSVCASPLMSENKVLGVLRAGSSDANMFSSDDLHALDIISGLAAVTLKNRLLLDRMEQLAIRDGLTGLYLPRYFQYRLSEELTRAALKSSKFSILMIDIDHFKKYNDEYGHTAGDRVLKDVAAVIMRCADPAELAARYGGEEFTMILPNKGPQEALATAERIRAEVQKNTIVLRRSPRAVTVSIGTASFPSDGTTVDGLVRHADERMYEAKKKGRNRVCGST